MYFTYMNNLLVINGMNRQSSSNSAHDSIAHMDQAARKKAEEAIERLTAEYEAVQTLLGSKHEKEEKELKDYFQSMGFPDEDYIEALQELLDKQHEEIKTQIAKNKAFNAKYSNPGDFLDRLEQSHSSGSSGKKH
jgi:non-homologous end joining protein Ku